MSASVIRSRAMVTSRLKPTMALFCDSAQPWLAISHEMKSFPRMHR
jgi:hypothetical protein